MRMSGSSLSWVAAIFLAVAGSQPVWGGDRAIPRPLPEHPGNVFLAGEDVHVALPKEASGAWRAVDYDGKVVGEGQAVGQISLGRLPAGYYEVRYDEHKPAIAVGVLAPLAEPTPKTSPICADVGMSWNYPVPRRAAVASLCALAGLNWVRDRLDWGNMEPRRGEFRPAKDNSYDITAQVESAAGLQILQVNHRSPKWASARSERFPTDLRDAYRFYREMAKRWQGQVQAFEPWNEADWVMFGGHTGAEMASMQKACYWGLKAGNPQMIVCQNVFANYFPRIIADFHANQAWLYFDTLSFHHYWAMDGLSKYYRQFREISGGRPIWVSECNLPVEWSGDEKLRELSDQNLREQAHRLVRLLALSIHEGASETFWFYFPHYTEGKQQFGIVHADLTPRPGYLALAAMGRLMADAKPLGRLRSENKELTGYLFRARPDGKERIVLIAWTKKDAAELPLKIPASAVFDTIGRVRNEAGTTLKVTDAPVFAVFPF